MNRDLTIRRMGALIGSALTEDGVTQADFARIVGVSAKHLNQVINGTATGRPTELDLWAFALDREYDVTLRKVTE